MNRPDWVVVWIAAIVAAVCLVWVGWALHSPQIAEWALHQQSVGNAGSWGDSFGAFNALFAALGFSAVFGTLLIQGRALRHQQEDQHRQRFESSFFELVALMRELRDGVSFRHSKEYRQVMGPSSGSPQVGIDAIETAVAEINHWLVFGESESGTLPKGEVAELYEKYVHGPSEDGLGPYFRVIYTILDRLRTDPILTPEERVRYGNLLRSQLTSHEVALAGFNGLSNVSKDFSALITQFRLLKYLPEGPSRRRLQRYYPSEAFEPRD